MTEKTAAKAIVDALQINGVDTVFGLPGAQMYPLFDSLYEASATIRTIGARHEQGLAYMAFGYARSSGRLGVYSPVPGPGVLNATAAMCTSLGACTPTLCLTGEIPSMFKGMGRGHLHELPDQLGILTRLTRYAQHIETPEDTPAAMTAAIYGALSGRKGPAAVSICWDHLGMSGEMADAELVADPVAPEPDTDVVAACVRLLREARQPIIFTGSGAQDASREIALLAEALNAPVVGFRGGRGIVGEDQPLGLSMAAGWNLWAECDLMIGIGTRLEIPFMRWGGMMRYNRSLPGRKLIRIDIDPAEMARLDTDGPLVADAAAGVSALVHALAAAGHAPQGDLERITEAKAKAAIDIRSVKPQMDYLDAIRDVLPYDGFLVEELSQVGFTSNFGFPVYKPRTYVSCGYQGTLGFGFPTALGVKVAHPDKAVVSITGDGGFQFALPELATAVQHGINLVTIVFDNACYGNVLRDQETRFNNHVIGADLVNPDFVKLADAYGVRSWVVDAPSQMRTALEAALALDAPALIQVRLPRGSEVSPWAFIHPQG